MKVNLLNPPILMSIAALALFFFPGCNNVDKTVVPPFSDYCQMLARDIAGKKHGFLAGNLMNYIAGQAGAEYNIIEHETIGFTHPLFDDSRSRGLGIVTDEYGTGHDFGGWEFYRHEKVAYGTVMVSGREYRHPAPKTMIWRPDRQITRYELDGVMIEETKFIALNDVLVCIITANQPVTLLFEGQSFFVDGPAPAYFGNPPGTPYMEKSEATAEYDAAEHCLHVKEQGGRVLARVSHDEIRGPAIRADFVYNGMSKVLACSKDFGESLEIEPRETGQQAYRFTIPVDPSGVVLTFAMNDDYEQAVSATREVLSDPPAALQSKTDFMNELLNHQMPWFRCSDPKVVETYYYLWALYFMYFRDVGKGFTPYPYAVTAINNFRTLFTFDAVSYIAMGSWVVDKPRWGYGNSLNFKSMLPHIRNGQVPETFGAEWWSPIYAGPLEFHVDQAWLTYQRSGDKAYLGEIYPFYRAVYDSKSWENYRGEAARDLIGIDALAEIAAVLGETTDRDKWVSVRQMLLGQLDAPWEIDTPNYYGSGKIKDVWNLAVFYNRDMPQHMIKAMTENCVMNSEVGFFGAVPLKIRAFDSEQIPPFNVNTINTWIAAEGMFRHHVDEPAIRTTLEHFRGMVKDYGFPVAPECWDENDKPWGSEYYAWDVPIALLSVERLTGVDFSLPDQTFTVCDHLPESWDFAEAYVPVTQNGVTTWTYIKISRDKTADAVQKTITVEGNSLKNLVVEPWLEAKELLSADPAGYRENEPGGHIHYEFPDKAGLSVKLSLKNDAN